MNRLKVKEQQRIAKHIQLSVLYCLLSAVRSIMLIISFLVYIPTASAQQEVPQIYVPYRDLPSLVAPDSKAVLMDRQQFEALLASAKAADVQLEDGLKLGQITEADYTVDISGENVTLFGKMTVVSISSEPVRINLGFTQVSLDSVKLNDKAAPLGYDNQGRLILIVNTKGSHQLEVTGRTKLQELTGGGMQFSMSLPQVVAGVMLLSTQGDMEIHSTAPVSDVVYNELDDKTRGELTIGGMDRLTVILTGNGRQEDDRAILLGESSEIVSLTSSDQSLGCLYTVQVLRRGVRQLQFQLDSRWTITDVTCPDLVRWSIEPPTEPNLPQLLTVRLRSAKTGVVALHISANKADRQQNWHSPGIILVDAASERGYMTISTDDNIGVRGESLSSARREDISAVAATSMNTQLNGRLYFHWGDKWDVFLELEEITLRTTNKENQEIVVSPQQITLTGIFDVTAVGLELYGMTFILRGAPQQWQLKSVMVDQDETNFEYRIEQQQDYRLLKIELFEPIQPEKMAKVTIVMQNIPEQWDWPSDAEDRSISLPLIESQADSVAGNITISAFDDLQVTPEDIPAELEDISVGRMITLGMQNKIQHAFSYAAPTGNQLGLKVSRIKPRISGESVGLVNIKAGNFTGDWRITYTISRASMKRLYLLADKSIGREIQITSQNVPLNSQNIISVDSVPLTIQPELEGQYDIWQLNLDSSYIGQVVLNVHYDRPKIQADFSVPLVRPICDSRMDEFLAVEADEELALQVDANSARDVDAIDLPSLPVEASRIVASFQLESPATVTGAQASITLQTIVHDNYEIPSAVVVSASLNTYLDVQLNQRTVADFRIANAGRQFLGIRLPEMAELWSLQVDGSPVKPQRSTTSDYQVSLGKPGRTVTVQVVFAYQQEGASFDSIQLGEVELPGLEINQMTWNVYPPPDYKVTSQITNMHTDDFIMTEPALIQLYNYFKNLRFNGILLGLMPRVRSSREMGALRRDMQTGTGALPPSSGYAAGSMSNAGARMRSEVETPQQPAELAQRQQISMEQQPVVMLTGQGRYTLPVTLIPTVGAGPRATFTGIDSSQLIIGLASQTRQINLWILGFVIMILLGLFSIKTKNKAILIIITIPFVTLLALWWPITASFANGLFWGAIILLPVSMCMYLIRIILQRTGWMSQNSIFTAAVLFFIIISIAEPVHAQSERLSRSSEPGRNIQLNEIIVPYSGSAFEAESSDRILVPYSRFVQLWNKAHPDDPIEIAVEATEIALSDVRYLVNVTNQFNLQLTAEIRTFGKNAAYLDLPISGLAATEVTLGGEPARLQAVDGRMLLLVPGDFIGQLQLKAVGTVNYLGQRGDISFTLPPLPAAVMSVVLPQENYQLEVDQLDVEPVEKEISGGTQWTFGLGLTRRLTMRWLPKTADSSIDRTLSADCEHEVYIFHWSIIGVSKITFNFTGGEHDRFTLLVPQDTTLTNLDGANVRDYRQSGEQVIDDNTFRLIEVRLNRAARRQYELSVNWMRSLDNTDISEQLPLIMAGNVSRESGTIVLNPAGGMGMQVTEVTGGRRMDIGATRLVDIGDIGSDIAVPSAKYYWPYRPFSIMVKLTRLSTKPHVNLDQLIRINKDRVELFTQATIKATDGRLFMTDFRLPDNYELISAVGPNVKNYYERSNTSGNFVHIEFESGQKETTIALVLTRNEFQTGDFSLPIITFIDSEGQTPAEQKGRIAVQVAPSLEAVTLLSENLIDINPVNLADWLSREQIALVQFAERYETENPSFIMNLSAKPTKIQAEIFSGLVIQTTSADYTYRVRYQISGSEVDNLSFLLPSQYASLVAVESPSLRSVTQTETNDGRTRWSISLTNEVTGLVDVLVNFSLPIDTSTQSLTVPRLEAEAVDISRTIVTVQNLSRHEINIQNRTALTELGLSEQQSIIPAQMRNSLQYVYQSFEQDWSLNLNLVQAKATARIQAVVDLLALTTVIDKDGSCRYEVKVELQNRSEQFMRVKIPQGLKLWSAMVASIPVKPVQQANSQLTEILIPLTKTSPGGLPYDITLYLADEQAVPLLEPFDGIVRLNPPAISIMDIPVTRTTWSLCLPGGYRYLRPSGNMSPVAGTAEVLSLNIEARLEQLIRLEKGYREIAGKGKVAQTQIVEKNLDSLNRKLATEIQQAQEYIVSNRNEISQGDYDRLMTQLGGQQQRQNVIMQENYDFVQQQAQFSNNMNDFLNISGSNQGVAESVRDNPMYEMPEFITYNEEQQLDRLLRQLNEANLGLTRPTGNEVTEETLQNQNDVSIGKKPEQLFADEDKQEQISRILEEVADKNNEAISEKQQHLQEQLQQLTDNRLKRYFNSEIESKESELDVAARTDISTTPGISGGRGAGRGAIAGGQSSVAGGRGGFGGGMQSSNFAPGRSLTAGDSISSSTQRLQNEPLPSDIQRERGMPSDLAERNDQAVLYLDAAGTEAYISTNIYSLPVTLPAGQVKLDFARSSGDAELSVLAVPVNAINNFFITIAVIVITGLLLGIARFWPRYYNSKPITEKRLIIYVVLLAVMSIILGVIGLVVSLLGILLSEVKRLVY